MPYKSEAQERWAHTPTGTKALGGSSKVAEWDAASKGKSLPSRASSGGKSWPHATPGLPSKGGKGNKRGH